MFMTLIYSINSVIKFCNKLNNLDTLIKFLLLLLYCCSLHAVTSSVIYYSTHTRKNVIYLLIISTDDRYFSLLTLFRTVLRLRDI